MHKGAIILILYSSQHHMQSSQTAVSHSLSWYPSSFQQLFSAIAKHVYLHEHLISASMPSLCAWCWRKKFGTVDTASRHTVISCWWYKKHYHSCEHCVQARLYKPTGACMHSPWNRDQQQVVCWWCMSSWQLASVGQTSPLERAVLRQVHGSWSNGILTQTELINALL